MSLIGFVAILTVCLLTAPIADGQTIRGTMTGAVADSTGGVVPGITVVATNPETNIASQRGGTDTARSGGAGGELYSGAAGDAGRSDGGLAIRVMPHFAGGSRSG